MLTYPQKVHKPDFDTSNSIRNHLLFNTSSQNKHNQKSLTALKHLKSNITKTGTTIVGVVTKEGVVLGADTRATNRIIAQKNCEKIHDVAPNIKSCGAGTAADNNYVINRVSAELELQRLNTGRETLVNTFLTRLQMHLFRYGGALGVYNIIAGYDAHGPHLCRVSATGAVNQASFMSMGSGSISALGVLETYYRNDLSLKEGMDLVVKAISAGITYDLMSGNNVDIVTLQKGKTEMFRNYLKLGQRVLPPLKYEFKKDNLVVIQTKELVWEDEADEENDKMMIES